MAKPETNYLIRGFRSEMQRVLTPRLADPLYNSALAQLRQLLAENRGPDGKVSPLLEKQLLPAVAVYRVMCTAYGCPELCTAFCAGHDTAYGHLHPRLRWRTAKTLAAGDDCCDFGLRLN